MQHNFVLALQQVWLQYYMLSPSSVFSQAITEKSIFHLLYIFFILFICCHVLFTFQKCLHFTKTNNYCCLTPCFAILFRASSRNLNRLICLKKKKKHNRFHCTPDLLVNNQILSYFTLKKRAKKWIFSVLWYLQVICDYSAWWASDSYRALAAPFRNSSCLQIHLATKFSSFFIGLKVNYFS